MARSPRSVAAALAIFAGCALSASSIAAPAGAAGGRCTPGFVRGAMRFCGPASARVSVFSGVTFRGGTCKQEVVAGERTLTLELGQLVPGSKTNAGWPYVKIDISGPLSRPTSGYLVAFYRGKRWSGLGDSLKASRRGGSFVVRGTPPSHGVAKGSFRC
jgi:hypothetical protein